MQELFSPIVIISLLAFAAVAAVVFVMAQVVTTQIRVQQRVGAPLNNAESVALGAGIDTLITNYFDEKYFGLDGSVRAKLRGQLIRAGYFRPDAINYYIFARFAVVAIGANYSLYRRRDLLRRLSLAFQIRSGRICNVSVGSRTRCLCIATGTKDATTLPRRFS